MANTDHIRAHNGWLQTAFLSLRKDQREIALLATVDVAPEDYFKRIADHIKRREKRGFAIVYDYAPATDPHKTLTGHLAKHGLVHLKESIPLEDYWISSAAEPDAADAKTDASDATLGGDHLADIDALAASLTSGEIPHPLHDLSQASSAEASNAKTLEVIKQQSENYHVYGFLGANRLGAVVDGLVRDGFALKDTQWMDVMSVGKTRIKTPGTIDRRRR